MPQRDLSRFGMLIFDEAHHLPSSSYRTFASRAEAPFRLGLSATLERSDGRHDDLRTLIGPTVFERQLANLARDKHIADYKVERVSVDLTDEEQVRNDQLTANFSWYMAANRSRLMMTGAPSLFEALIRSAGHDPAARNALRAHREARMLAMNAERPSSAGKYSFASPFIADMVIGEGLNFTGTLKVLSTAPASTTFFALDANGTGLDSGNNYDVLSSNYTVIITPNAVPKASTFGSLGLLLAGLGFAALTARKRSANRA